MNESCRKKSARGCVWAAGALLGSSLGVAARQQQPEPAAVTAQVQIVQRGSVASSRPAITDFSDAVVWLVPLDKGEGSEESVSGRSNLKLVQRNKMFEPHVLAIQAGSFVEFPNKDPFFHNVFSLFDGKRFDLGLYEAGTSKTVRFDRVGVSFIFCNIHENMSAIIVAVPSSFFGRSDAAGHLKIPNVPDGRYQMHVWYERSSSEDLKTLDRTVTISAASRALEPIQIAYNPQLNLSHKNKYGQDYVAPAAPPGTTYP